MKLPSTEGEGFISYRRQESDALATLLKDRLKSALPGWNFFVDFGSIPAGTDFKAVIGAGLDRSDLVVVLIEENWIGARANGTARISEENDFIRYEVGSALTREIRVLPVLVNDAKMPQAPALPADIVKVRDLNAVELRVSRFEDDFANLVLAISGKPLRRDTDRIATRLLWWLGGALGVIVIGSLGLFAQYKLTGRSLDYWVGGTEATILSALWVLAGVWVGDLVRKWRR